MTQFLRTLVEQGLIFFDFEATSWDWDAEKINQLEVSEDIVEFLVHNTLQDDMHKDTLEVLRFAACLGTPDFNSFILSRAVGIPPEEVLGPLHSVP
jgi:predicted ATPase